MTDLLTWLRAQLDEDERVALACEHQIWTCDGGSIHGGHEADPVVDWVYDEGGWEHIARHDPASVLADIAAKRAIVDKLEFLTAGTTPSDRVRGLPAAYREVVRLLASAYAHRPGYLPEWSPVPGEP